MQTSNASVVPQPSFVPVVVSSPHDALEFDSGASDAGQAILPRRMIWDVPFDRLTLPQAVDQISQLVDQGRPSYVITANLNYVMLHHQRPELAAVTRDADLILADGQPIVWRSKLGSIPLPERVAGSELIFKLAALAAERGWGIFFLGGEPGVAEKCAQRLATDYPGTHIAGIESPPFRPLSETEQLQLEQRIGDSGAQILLVAFGQPKGEIWIHQHYQRIGVPVSIQLGASFDFIAGTATRAPHVWQKLGMEWAYRMFSDPKRLIPRYASNALFLLRMMISNR